MILCQDHFFFVKYMFLVLFIFLMKHRSLYYKVQPHFENKRDPKSIHSVYNFRSKN